MREVEQRVHQQRLAVADDETGVGEAPPADLKPGVAAVAEIVVAGGVRHAIPFVRRIRRPYRSADGRDPAPRRHKRTVPRFSFSTGPPRYGDGVEPAAIPIGRPRGERADAARNRAHLLDTARLMIAECGADRLTMDGLAERAGLGKGTVFRRFGTRAGIFQSLLNDDETEFQQRVLFGPPPLGPGADPVDRLVAYGRARIEFLLGRVDLARASAGAPGGPGASRPHIQMLVTQTDIGTADPTSLAVQLTAALEGPILRYLRTSEHDADAAHAVGHLADSWQLLTERTCRRR